MAEALIVVDMIIDFVYGRFGNPQARSIIPNIQQLVESARATGRHVLYVEDNHLTTDPELRVHGPHAMKGTPEAEPIQELQPAPDECRFEKRSYSGFRDTGLDVTLRAMGVSTVVLVGVTTGGCVLHTASDAFALGYYVVVPQDCVIMGREAEHQDGLRHMRRSYGAIITTSADLSQQWAGVSVESK